MVQTPEAIRDLMQELQRERRTDQAITVCNSAMSEIDQSDVHRLLGYRAYAHWQAGRHEEALADIEAAITSAPKWPGHMHQYMYWCVELELFDDAAKASKRLIALETERGSTAFIDSALFFLSLALLQLGEWEKALAVARKVRDEKPIWVSGGFVSRADLIEAAAKKTRLNLK